MHISNIYSLSHTIKRVHASHIPVRIKHVRVCPHIGIVMNTIDGQ